MNHPLNHPADHPANPSTALARTVLDELVRGGVCHVVLAPGSRSAPLAFAAHEAAGRGRVRLHTRIDERSAGFLGLGLARSARAPVAVVTTSGTATANLHPAVLEACHAGLALVLLTADRPARLRGTGANQTTDQVRLYGGAVRCFADVPAAVADTQQERQVASWRSLVARVVGTAQGPRPGPVHLNLQLAEPLTPHREGGWTAPIDGRPDEAPWTLPPAVAHPDPDGAGAVPVRNDRRTVVVAGDDAGPPARVLAERAGWPLLAEPTSGARTGENVVRTYRLLLDDPGLSARIERVVVCGHPTLSRPVGRLLGRTDVEVVAVPTRTGWTDPGHTVARVADALSVEPGDGDVAWLAEWRRRDAALCTALDGLLARRAALTPHHVAGAVAASLPPGGLLFVGASNPVRDLDLMAPAHPVGQRRLTVANRGLSGIDGTVSAAVGAALGRPGTSRALALLGDVTFLHDSNGLVLGPQEERPDLTLVVVNDDGGSIFASLEQGDPSYADSYDRLFGTPHHVDLAALCAATGTPHRRVHDRADLVRVLREPAGGVEVVEAVVRRDDRRELDAAIRHLVAAQR